MANRFWSGAPSMRTLFALAAAAGAAAPALADDDDKKMQDARPAVVGPIRGGPDAWKLLREPLTAAQLGFGDDTFESLNISFKSWVPLNNFAGFAAAIDPQGADCWGYTAPSGREYALMGLSWGNGFVEITDPENPVVVATIPGQVNSTWRDITVIGHHAYAVSDQTGVGIQVMDLSQIDTGTVTLVRNHMQGGHTTTHSMVENTASGYLYLQGGNAAGGGFIPADCNADPTAPTFTGPGWTNQYVHEAQVITYPPSSGPYSGKEIAFLFAAGPYYGSSYTRCMSIVDITNKAAPQTLSYISYPGMIFCHQGWVSADRKYLYVDDEIDGPSFGVPWALTRVFDITDLSNPRLVSSFTNGLNSVDHNQYVSGRYLYQSNYTSGLRVWDLSTPLKPVEIAWFDTRPEGNESNYLGNWGNFPFFQSGSVVLSDRQRGLFTVRLSLLELSLPAAAPAVLTPGQPTPVGVHVAEKEAMIGGVSLMVSTNGGSFTAHPMAAAGGGLYTGEIPAASCADRVRYFFRAVTDEPAPRAFTWPVSATGTPVETLAAVAQFGQTDIFADDFEVDHGWTVQSSAGAAGAWVRAAPLHNGGPGAVIGDGDGSGQCFITGGGPNQGVQGTTTLLSPAFDLSAHPEARVEYSRWLVSILNITDQLTTEVSNNNGSTWTQVHTVGPVSGGWDRASFRVADVVAPSEQVRVRFTVSNSDSSVTEAGIDAFRIVSPVCTAPCYANCDGSTTAPILNVSDFTCFLNRFAASDPYANCDGSTAEPVLNVNDFVCFTNEYAGGCP